MTNNIDKKRAQKIRRKLKKVNTNRFRLTVFRSSRNISAQIIDDKKNETLVSATSISKKTDNINKKDLSLKVAEKLTKQALDKKITKVYFDRGRYKYHGRIKSFADTLRKGGLNF